MLMFFIAEFKILLNHEIHEKPTFFNFFSKLDNVGQLCSRSKGLELFKMVGKSSKVGVQNGR